MGKLTISTPAQGSRIIRDDRQCILVGQPPEVLKGLLNNGITSFDTMVLTDVRERRGSLINNLEFPFYFFLFWLPQYLIDARGFDLRGIAMFAWLPWVAADLGALATHPTRRWGGA